MRRSTTPKPVLRALTARDGHRCAWHPVGECDPETLVPQHRQGGMGGRRDKHRLSNVVWLCSLVNGHIESHPACQEAAVLLGIKISLHADPTQTPIWHAVHGRVLLTDDGGYVRLDDTKGDA